MSRILFIYEREMPTVSAMRRDYTKISEEGSIDASFVKLTDVSGDMLNGSDCVVFIRPEVLYAVTIAKKVKKSGRMVITFLDDDLLNREGAIPWRTKGLRDILKYTDVIWSCSHYICEKYVGLSNGKRDAQSDSIVDIADISDVDEKKDSMDQTVRIVYAAAASHYVFFDEYIRPILDSLDKRYGANISLTFVGVKPELDTSKYSFDIDFVDGMPLLQYREYMRKADFDLGLAPLPENDFTKCKYINKYIEYGMMGITGVYSDIIPYNRKVVDGINGYLAKNSEQGWFEAVCRAIDNKDERIECAINTCEDLKKNHSQDGIISKLKVDIPEMFSGDMIKSRIGSILYGRVIYYLLRPADMLYLSIYYTKNQGIKGFMKKMAGHFKR